MKYFYRDPLDAAYMAKHFGMQFTDMFEVAGIYASGKYRQNKDIFDCNIYIRATSLHLLEPRVNDLVKSKTSRIACGLILDEQHCAKITMETHVIIQRDGIAFIWPESEE